MPVTRINNNQLSDAASGNIYVGVNAASKLQNYSITSTKISNNLTYGSDLTITGNLTVQGNTTTIDTVNVIVEDPLILLAAAQTGSPALDIGFIGKRGTSENIAFVWDEANDAFVTAFTSSEVTNTTISIGSYTSFTTGNANVTGNLSVTGTSGFTGNVTIANLYIDPSSLIDVGNNRITNLALPSANTDAATKAYVDSQSASGFTLSDGANTQTVSGGDTLTVLGTTDQIATLVSATDNLQISLTPNVTISGNILAGNLNSNAEVTGVTITASGNLVGGNANITNGVYSTTVDATGNVLAGNLNSNAEVTGVTITASGNLVGGNANITNGVYATTVTTTGNVSGGNITTAGQVTATGNITGGNLISNALISGVTGEFTGNLIASNIQSNGEFSAASISTSGNVLAGNLNSNAAVTGVTITASGNLVGGNANITNGVYSTTVDATGNVLAGNLNANNTVTGTTITATGNVNGGNVNTNSIVGTAITITSTGDLDLVPSGNVNLNSRFINDLGTPFADSDAATKGYVDSVAQGLDVKASVVYATVAALPAYTYNNGTSGVDATLTAQAVGNLSIDGTVVASGERVLIKNESGPFVDNTTSSAAFNGIYVVTTAGAPGVAFVLTRATDFDNGSPSGEIPGAFTFVEYGASLADTGWVCTTNSPVTVGTTEIVFAQFSGAGSYTAGNGLTLTGTVFSVNVDNETTAISAGNVIVKAGANLVTPNIGNATGNSVTLTGNGLLSATTVSATGNVSGANANITNGVYATSGDFTGNLIAGNVQSNGAFSAASISTAGNVLAGNVNSNAAVTGVTITASGNLVGANANITNGVYTSTLDATGQATVGNLSTAGAIFATGNITGGNLISNALVSGISGAFTGNLIAGNVESNGAFTAASISTSGNVLAGNLNSNAAVTGVTITASGNLVGGNANITNGVYATTGDFTGNLIAGNVNSNAAVTGVTGEFTGNVLAGNVNSNAAVTGVTITATGNISGNNITGTTSGKFGNIVISGDDITDTNGRVNFNTAGADVDFAVNGDTVANMFYVDAGTGTASFGSATQTTGAVVAFNSNDSILLPVGNSAVRPTGVTGMLRFNTTNNQVEFYDNDSWVGTTTEFTVIVNDSFVGNGVQTNFTLSQTSTTASTIVAINGVMQIPTIAYAVSGTTLAFTEAPEPSDYIDVRILTTTTSAISIGSGNTIVATDDINIITTGNIVPTANATYDLGNSTNWWRDGYFSGNTIYLGSLQLKTSGNTFTVFTADGTTQANIDAGSIDVSSIGSGNSAIGIAAPNGNAYITVGGQANILVVTTAGANVTGTLGVTGNITGSYILGNGSQLSGIDATSIQNGSANVRAFNNGNVTVSAAGTANVLVITSTGANIDGTLNVVGNINATGNLNYQNVTDLVVGDPLIYLGANNVGDLDDLGFVANWDDGVYQHGGLARDASDGTWKLFGNVIPEPTTVIDFTNAIYQPLKTGVITTTGLINGNGNGVGNIGSSSGYFNTVFAKATSAQYADLAEMYNADQLIESGTVVEFGGVNEVTVCLDVGSKRVAGVVSTNPSYIMNSGLQGDYVVAVALTGRVPVKVTGQVRKGDMMVAAGNGYAKAEANPTIGSVIGKALADFDGTDGIIEVVVGRM